MSTAPFGPKGHLVVPQRTSVLGFDDFGAEVRWIAPGVYQQTYLFFRQSTNIHTMYIYIYTSLSLYDYGDGDDDNLYEAVIQ